MVLSVKEGVTWDNLPGLILSLLRLPLTVRSHGGSLFLSSTLYDLSVCSIHIRFSVCEFSSQKKRANISTGEIVSSRTMLSIALCDGGTFGVLSYSPRHLLYSPLFPANHDKRGASYSLSPTGGCHGVLYPSPHHCRGLQGILVRLGMSTGVHKG